MNWPLTGPWPALSYRLANLVSVWLLLVLLGTALACWRLAAVLESHNARTREAALAKKAALAYTAGAVGLWLFAWVFG